MTERKFIYGQQEAVEINANGVEGMLLRSFDGTYFFRVYHGEGQFVDYELCHSDLAVTISEDALASFYKVGDTNILDHSPEVLGLREVAGDDK